MSGRPARRAAKAAKAALRETADGDDDNSADSPDLSSPTAASSPPVSAAAGNVAAALPRVAIVDSGDVRPNRNIALTAAPGRMALAAAAASAPPPVQQQQQPLDLGAVASAVAISSTPHPQQAAEAAEPTTPSESPTRPRGAHRRKRSNWTSALDEGESEALMRLEQGNILLDGSGGSPDPSAVAASALSMGNIASPSPSSSPSPTKGRGRGRPPKARSPLKTPSRTAPLRPQPQTPPAGAAPPLPSAVGGQLASPAMLVHSPRHPQQQQQQQQHGSPYAAAMPPGAVSAAGSAMAVPLFAMPPATVAALPPVQSPHAFPQHNMDPGPAARRTSLTRNSQHQFPAPAPPHHRQMQLGADATAAADSADGERKRKRSEDGDEVNGDDGEAAAAKRAAHATGNGHGQGLHGGDEEGDDDEDEDGEEDDDDGDGQASTASDELPGTLVIPARARDEDLKHFAESDEYPESFQNLARTVLSMRMATNQSYSGDRLAIEQLRRDITSARVIIKETHRVLMPDNVRKKHVNRQSTVPAVQTDTPGAAAADADADGPAATPQPVTAGESAALPANKDGGEEGNLNQGTAEDGEEVSGSNPAQPGDGGFLSAPM